MIALLISIFNKYIILISGLSNSIYIEEDDALCIISKLNIVNDF